MQRLLLLQHSSAFSTACGPLSASDTVWAVLSETRAKNVTYKAATAHRYTRCSMTCLLFSALATASRAQLTAPPPPAVPVRPLAVRRPKQPRTPTPAAPAAAGVVTPYVADLAPHIEALTTSWPQLTGSSRTSRTFRRSKQPPCRP